MPPYCSWMAFCEITTLDRTVPSLRTTATPVSSHEVSMPSTTNGAASPSSAKCDSPDGSPDLAPAARSST